uniref:ATP synthase complex subunit 8 n=1 Tax=Rhyacotriton variegatus TaxID=291264 RepID=Q644W7_9SALA|nr:ATP synthase F0 subunit 8 [Rhyacotriton variegatus]AAU20517.1 ATP synthase F0 subunit 8 [Rhyacotriton variegatus]
MPQLNPNPWLTIFMVAWLMYLFLLMFKMNLKMTNELMLQNINKFNNKSWYWPWT